jgi:hypothetical protein
MVLSGVIPITAGRDQSNSKLQENKMSALLSYDVVAQKTAGVEKIRSE